MKSKRIFCTLIILVFLNGCMGGRELNELAIAISMGIDKAEDGYLLTFQILNPKAIASRRAQNEAPIILYTETGKDLFEIKRRITEQSPRKIYNSHLRTVVFGEDMAKEGIQQTLDFFVRGHEYRTGFFFLVAKGTTANHILKELTPLEVVPGIEIYNSLKTSEESWAPTKTVKLYKLVNDLISDGKDPVLTGIKLFDPKNPIHSIEILKQSDPTKLMVSNLAVFRDDKLAGWLNEDESKGYNYIMGNVKNTVGEVKYDDQGQVTFEAIKTKVKRKATLLNNKPAINVEIMVKANVVAQTGELDLTSEEIIEKISRKAEGDIEDVCNAALEITRKDFKTDVFGFGEEIHKKYPKLWKQVKNNWNDEFARLPINVKAHVQINGLGESTKSVFSKGNE
ncbi:MAG: Ger(x)C family spore germination protein [Thermoclostridium sp.]|nr:Ger(x)C family spore germination protein [Thermoclostridium sp.]